MFDSTHTMVTAATTTTMIKITRIIITRIRSEVIGLPGAVSEAAVCTPVLYSLHSISDVF